MGMTPKLPEELANALHANGDGLEVIDPATNRVYVIVDGDIYRQAFEALLRQNDRNAIAEGLAQMDEGKGKPAEQAFEEMRERLRFSQSQ